MTTEVILGPADLRDQRWLDERVADIENGVEAVVDIARNWTEGRNLSRLHPGVSAAAYVTERVGTLGKSVVPVLLRESNWSHRQIATVAGVDRETVTRQLAEMPPVERPPKTLGADGRLRTTVVVIEPEKRARKLLVPPPPRHPIWWASVGHWLRLARKEDMRTLRELDERVHEAMERNER